MSSKLGTAQPQLVLSYMALLSMHTLLTVLCTDKSCAVYKRVTQAQWHTQHGTASATDYSPGMGGTGTQA